MKAEELIQNSRMVIDAAGKTEAVQIDYALWEELLELLEGLEDAAESGEAYSQDRLNERYEPRRPFGLCAGEFTTPDNFDDPLPDGVIEQFEGRI